MNMMNMQLLQTPSAYWKNELAGAPTQLVLPTDKPRSPVPSLGQAREPFVLPAGLGEQLKSMESDASDTAQLTLLAGFLVLLNRYTDQDDILIGTIFARTRRPAGGANPVVVRARFSDRLPFRSLFQQMRERAREAAAHADFPFEQLVAEFVPQPDSSHAPLCQVMFVTGSAADLSDNRSWTGRCDLTLFLTDRENGLDSSIAYRTDLFEPQTIRRMCGHYEEILKAIARDPDQDILMLPLLTERERMQILYEWNDTRVDYPPVCAHQLFEQQVAHQPEAIALVFENRQLSYRELNQRANQVALYLRKRGVGPEVLVGVCLERSPELVIALLGVWKAGGAYVPLDPTHPGERLSYILRDAAAKVLLTDAKLGRLFGDEAVLAIGMDSDWPKIEQESTGNLDGIATPANLAYLMYTSGSTGQPKGALILHHGLVNYLCWAKKAYAVDQGEAVPFHTSIAFDLTVTAVFVPLVGGGRIEILREDVGGQHLVRALDQGRERSLVKITPAHLSLLGEQLGPERVAARAKLFVIGGENLSAESLQVWREHAPATRLINEYGPTETVVGCCIHEVVAGEPRSGSVPIGRPIANTQLYILDRHRNPLPPGLVGELYIGGAGVARGYWNRPELTQEQFLRDPFSPDRGARLYRTGDLARYRADGTLEFLGRLDNQVKVRGYRIELGEIEASLGKHPLVKACAVLAREDTPGNKQLVGYVVPGRTAALATEELRQFLRNHLPEYMVPAQLVFLDELPLTSNGKIDRAGLPAPSRERELAGPPGVEPRSETEQKLWTIWRELLDVPNMGIDDNFFELGGHSLQALQVISRIRDVFAAELSAQDLFDEPTIAGLARIITAKTSPHGAAQASA